MANPAARLGAISVEGWEAFVKTMDLELTKETSTGRYAQIFNYPWPDEGGTVGFEGGWRRWVNLVSGLLVGSLPGAGLHALVCSALKKCGVMTPASHPGPSARVPGAGAGVGRADARGSSGRSVGQRDGEH
jgi:hypothetical protein